jgi:hypothetical protein
LGGEKIMTLSSTFRDCCRQKPLELVLIPPKKRTERYLITILVLILVSAEIQDLPVHDE